MTNSTTLGGETRLVDELLPAGGTPHEEEVRQRLLERLALARRRLTDLVEEPADQVTSDLVGYVIAGGGKLMRPLLALLGGEFGDEPLREGVLDAAVLAELVHVASLYHDDVVDEALTRRGRPSVNERFGNRMAVFGGNWLLARAARLAVGLGPEVVQRSSAVADQLVRGQVRELRGPEPGEDAFAYYSTVASGKTASLISMALQLGAGLARADEATVRLLGDFGEHLGVAFQISDDLLDFTSPSATTGKEQGKDLAVGVASLPVLLAISGDGPEAVELRDLLYDGAVADEPGRQRALELLTKSSAVDDATTIMDNRLAMARVALGRLPEHPARRALAALCDFVPRRVS